MKYSTKNLSSACFGKQIHPQMDQTSCNAEQIEVVEDLSQALKIIFYPLPLYYHLVKGKKKSFEIVMEKKLSKCCSFLQCCGAAQHSLVFLSCALLQPRNNQKDSCLMYCTELLSFFPKRFAKIILNEAGYKVLLISSTENSFSISLSKQNDKYKMQVKPDGLTILGAPHAYFVSLISIH